MMETLPPPRFAEIGPLLIVGTSESYTDATSTNIPAQWDRFAPHIGKVPGQILGAYYGLLMPTGKPGQWDYACGVEISEVSQIPVGFQQFTLPKSNYAVFVHTGCLATLRDTWGHIWTEWLPKSKLKVARSARVEKYADTFRSNLPGGLEIWIPLAP